MKKWIAVGVAEGILLIAFFLAALFHKDVNIQIPQEEMLLYRIIGEEETREPGAYVDKSYDGYSFSIGPDMLTLDRGYYLVTIDYQTNIESGCVSTVTSSDFREASIRTDTVPLLMEKDQISYRIFIRDDGMEVYIENREWSDQPDGYLLIEGVKIQTFSGSQWYSFFVLLVIFLLTNLVLYLRKKYRYRWESKQQRFVFAMIAVIITMTCFAQGMDYLIEGQDLDFHLKRIEGIKEGLLNGNFPVKIYPLWLHENGYAAGVFYGDLFLYIPAVLRIIGFSIQTAYQIYLFLINVGTVIISYLCFKKMARNVYIGLIACMVYSLTIYRLNNIYVRGAVGEYTAMMFLPLIICGLWQIFTEETNSENYRYKWIMPTIGYSGLIVSHVLSCEMVGLFTIVTCLLLWKRTFQKNTFMVLLKTVLSTIILNLWFIVPFFDYYFTTTFKVNNPLKMSNYYYWIQKSGIYFPQMFSTEYEIQGWDQYTTAGISGEMPQTIGLAITFIILFAVLDILINKNKELYLPVGLTALALFMSSNVFPYDWLCYHIPFIRPFIISLQYPWRFLSLASALACWVLILILQEGRKKNRKHSTVYLAIGICCLCSIQSISFMSRIINERGPLRIFDTAAFGNCEWVGLEYIKKDANYQAFSRKVEKEDEYISFNNYERKGLEATADVKNNGDTEKYIDIPIHNYKGFHAIDTVTREEFTIEDGKNCCIRIYFRPGYQGNIHVYFNEPILWRAAELISLISVLVGGIYFWRRRAGGKLLIG